MCFRPSAVKRNDIEQKTCQTCGMPVGDNVDTCPYCGDPIPAEPTDEFGNIDPSHNARIL